MARMKLTEAQRAARIANTKAMWADPAKRAALTQKLREAAHRQHARRLGDSAVRARKAPGTQTITKPKMTQAESLRKAQIARAALQDRRELHEVEDDEFIDPTRLGIHVSHDDDL